MAYLHGAYGEIGESKVASVTQADVVAAYIGTAPVNLIRGYADKDLVNMPVKVTNMSEVQSLVGYSDDWETFTLGSAFAEHFDNTVGNVGPIYIVNVLDPAVHKSAQKTTIYSYIEKGIFLRLTNKDLPVKGDKKRSYHKVQTQKRAPKGESIEKRPEIIGERSTFGHWEMDTVVSARPGKAAILVLTERLTRNEITAKLPDKSAASVVQALDDLEKEWGELFPRVFQTITVDNGSEFADCPGIERSILAEGSRTKCYYCHPYSSYERGSNENLNKMIRRWLPKGTNFDEIGAEVIQTITNWLNNYPRKILGFLPASAAFQEQMDALLGA